MKSFYKTKREHASTSDSDNDGNDAGGAELRAHGYEVKLKSFWMITVV